MEARETRPQVDFRPGMVGAIILDGPQSQPLMGVEVRNISISDGTFLAIAPISKSMFPISTGFDSTILPVSHRLHSGEVYCSAASIRNASLVMVLAVDQPLEHAGVRYSGITFYDFSSGRYIFIKQDQLRYILDIKNPSMGYGESDLGLMHRWLLN